MVVCGGNIPLATTTERGIKLWLYVPKLYCQSVQESEESNLVSDPVLKQELSVTWKTKSLSQQSLQRLLTREPSTTLLSGLTCDPLTQSRGVTRYLSSLAESHAHLGRPLLSTGAKKTKEIYTQPLNELSMDYGHQFSFLKMSLASSDISLKPSGQTFKEWATQLRLDYTRRQKLVRHTNDNDCSSLHSQRDTFSNWQTPNASEHKYRLKGNSQQSNGLTAQARRFSLRYIHHHQKTTIAGHACSLACQRLRPAFAEKLMGFPVGWTSVSEPLEMQSFQRWQELLLETYPND